ncbi:MAG TPA: DUF1549 domain-containing protein, partial [Gemmataceae bacterium]|nr:DUF1549 domain-containing protein [Gemmataceae bacterium]
MTLSIHPCDERRGSSPPTSDERFDPTCPAGINPTARRIVTLVALTLLLTPAARADEPRGVEFFEKRIRPLLVEHCYRCHSATAGKVKAHLLLDTREGVLKGGDSGTALVAGKPSGSLLLKAVRYDTDLRMPPKGKLAAAEIADLEAWIRMGAPDPRDGKAAAVVVKTPIAVDAGKNLWAFRPVVAKPPPAVRDTAWPLGDVDRFLLAPLEAKGLTPAPPTDRPTLLRRVTYDLTGLPPTPDEIAAFMKDESPDAFARVVDRLLASSAYGERWGRHWLDVVRYADTAGDNSDYPIPQMVKYRDWVIRAFNQDMPYDRFVRLQVAGDELEPGNPQALMATGFLAAGVHSTQITANTAEKE